MTTDNTPTQESTADATMTPEQQKLDTMTGGAYSKRLAADADIPSGRTTSTPGAARLAAAQAAPVTADETRRQAIMKDPKWLTGDAALLSEMKQILARQATPEEKQAISDASLSDHRAVFGLTVPDERVLPKAWHEEYATEFEGHEQDFLLAAREHGLESKLVGELREAGIRLAVEAEGRPASAEAWAAMEKRFTGRLTPQQFKGLKTWWRKSVDGSESTS